MILEVQSELAVNPKSKYYHLERNVASIRWEY